MGTSINILLTVVRNGLLEKIALQTILEDRVGEAIDYYNEEDSRKVLHSLLPEYLKENLLPSEIVCAEQISEIVLWN